MGEKGRQIVDLDVDALVAELRKAYLDELQAFYSYWVSAVVAEGFHGMELAEHFEEEAREELGHARRLAERILQLGGDPVVHPSRWEAGANAPWTAPPANRADAEAMLRDQLKAEAGAIDVYNRLARMTFGKDPVTYQLATELLADEVRHEEFLEDLLAHRGRSPRG